MLKGEMQSDEWIVTWSDLKRSDILAEKSIFFAEEFINKGLIKYGEFVFVQNAFNCDFVTLC